MATARSTGKRVVSESLAADPTTLENCVKRSLKLDASLGGLRLRIGAEDVGPPRGMTHPNRKAFRWNARQ
jgi:hypothetical protein